MGKDQDLLDAARCGNITVVERLLNQRAKKTGPLASLRRGPGPNIQDGSGYTPLHHSSLNGHKDIVALLLSYDASTNVVDDKGCTPLHLAAWSGNTEIVKLLLIHGPSLPNVNHMNFDHESALHSAAQYGHAEVVKLLLQYNCNPSVRNVKNESPLDLASQYGRLETVQCLIKAHPELLTDLIRTHSSLHLASKNGHKGVVKVLLDAGFDINYMTDVGTALHEAAMYGKLEVVRLLLDYGVNANAENCRKRTVFDILQDLNTGIAKQIVEVIKDHMTLIKLDSDSNDSFPILPPQGFLSGALDDPLIPERYSFTGISPPRQFCSSSPESSVYEIPPPPKLLDNNLSGNDNSLSSLTPSRSQDSSFDQTSFSSCSPSKCEPIQSPVYENCNFQTVDSEDLLFEIPPPPTLFSNKRFSDPLQQNVIYQNVILPDCQDKIERGFESSTLPTSWTLPDSYIPMQPIHFLNCNNRPQPPAKPPRKSVTPSDNDRKDKKSDLNSEKSNYEFLCLATSGLHHAASQNCTKNKKNNFKAFSYPTANSPSEYVDMSSQNSMMYTYENREAIISNGIDAVGQSIKINPIKSSCQSHSNNKFFDVLPFSFSHEDAYRKSNSFHNLMPSKSTPALHASRHTLDQVLPIFTNDREFHALKPDSLNFRQKRASVQIPTSPTNYQQPPTPDIPPPSPATAETGIYEKIHPINQEYRSKKNQLRDIDTITDEHLVATIGPCGEVQLTLATDNKCVATENTEVVSNNPFAGLCRGSVLHTEKCRKIIQLPASLPKSGQSFASQGCNNIYENVGIIMEDDKNKVVLSTSGDYSERNSNRSSLSVMSPFDEKAEWAEIADIMASFGGSIARESTFAEDMESHFTQTFRAGSQKFRSSCTFASVEQWLASLGLPQYENVLIINGFDEICFLGGKIIEDQDLEELGIVNPEHRQKISTSSQRLPAIQPVSLLKGTPEFPSSVDDWLSSLNLHEYIENFSNNNINNMDRALKLWEVEINTVLKITKIGHRKRIMASIGDKRFENYMSSEELDLSKLAHELSELGVDDDKYCVVKTTINPTYESCMVQNSENKSYLRIRPPTQLMTDSTELHPFPHQLAMEAQWRHHPDDLIQGCCDYMAKYLGSTLVKELKGLESTKKSIQKLKSSSQDIGKIPTIILSISYSGVKFINAETQQLVCEHEIRNIHCACQDAEDLRHFAYITKEHQTHNHYCHVFSSENMDLASEIILTLGQAFEVAYQIVVQEKAERTGGKIRDPSIVSVHSGRRSYDSRKKSAIQS